VTDLRADPLSPIDAATLWPQLRRLSTEVIATRAGENLLLSSGLAATGLTNLPRVPRTAVLGLKRGLGYRGVLVSRELAGGAGWETVSLRISRDKDDEAVTALLAGAATEAARRAGRTLYLRYPEGSPHARAIQRAGLMPYRNERLYALRQRDPGSEGSAAFRPATRADRAGIFRLYCRVMPEHVRRHEAPTAQDWRAVVDSYDCEREFVAEGDRGLIAWAGVSEREARLMVDTSVEGLGDAALDLVELQLGRQAALVLAEDQGSLEHNAAARGYTPLGVRLMCARRLAVLNPLKEVVAVAGPFALPQ
jgi:hypothetical protein